MAGFGGEHTTVLELDADVVAAWQQIQGAAVLSCV